MIQTIKELKNLIKDLPDDMDVMGYNGGNGDLVVLSHWIISKETLTEEEIKEGYPDGLTPILVISTD